MRNLKLPRNFDVQTAIAIIMGVELLPDGSPSPALLLRTEAALRLRQEFEHILYIPTGGSTKKHLRTEAEVIQELLIAGGVEPEKIMLEAHSRNTLENLINCKRILKNYPHVPVVICSESFHLYRARWLLYMLGISSLYRPMPNSRMIRGWPLYSYLCIREFAAIVADIVLVGIYKLGFSKNKLEI